MVAVGSIRPRILKVHQAVCSRTEARVAVGSIRPRILKEPERPRGRSPQPCCSGLDPTEDTERAIGSSQKTAATYRCSGLDPTEDTERGDLGRRGEGEYVVVAVGSIRPRILKDPRDGRRAQDREVAVGSIRPRILKGLRAILARLRLGVAVGSIRPRILKDFGDTSDDRWDHRCSGLDPTEDTERSLPPF